MKKILFLGGAHTQIPPLRYAREQGYHVITCDYLEHNPGHRLAHEYHNVSTTDKDAVLDLAARLNIDAIVAYASDPAAPTAAYVGNRLGLPSNPYDAVLTLARKDLFRDFLGRQGLNVPPSRSFREREDAQARTWLREIGAPAFIKPVDSSGSKGVTRLDNPDRFDAAFDHALSFSREKMVVVEKCIPRMGYQVDSDVFMVDGELAFWIWGNQHQDAACTPYAPVGISFPSALQPHVQQKAAAIVGDLLKALGFRNGAFNVEFLLDRDDQVWLLEIGPRNGGNLIPQAIHHATGIDLVKYTVDAALGLDCSGLRTMPAKGYWSSYLVHARASGDFQGVQMSSQLRARTIASEIWARPGQRVEKYAGSHHTLGTMILRFTSMNEMLDMMDNMERHIHVVVK